jgi:hypothetical protein
MFSYDTHVRPYAHQFIRIKMDTPELRKACKWALDMCDAKSIEMIIVRDSCNSFKRLLNGVIGEMAIEKLLGFNFIDWSIGESKDYARPDLVLSGHNIGIKTVEYGKFPIIPKLNDYTQFINIYRKNDNICFICGLAEPDVLNKYQSDDLVLSDNLRRKGTKTAFYGFEHLIKPQDIKLS